MSCIIIAEAGVNHNGSEEMAYQLVDAAKKAGADIVKFQVFKAEKLANKNAKQAQYQVENTQKQESQLAMLKGLELSFESHQRIHAYCQQQGIEYLSTAFDDDSLLFLTESLKLSTLKLPSGELTNAPFVLKHALTGCNLIVSTGMATLDEIEFALSIIAFGFLAHYNVVNVELSEQAFKQALASEEGRKLLKEKVTLLHCTTEYPAPFDEVHLNAMALLRDTFDIPVGYSDHTKGIAVSLASVTLGANILEKHFTLDKNLPGPDHKASIEPNELADLVSGSKEISKALGNRIKIPSTSEQKNIAVARKSIFAKHNIKKGQMISEDDLIVQRPGDGLSAKYYYQILGRQADKDYFAGESLDLI